MRTALETDGWTITHDPLLLEFGRRNVYVDLGAEAPLGAEKDGRKIAVEIKTFLGPSEMTDLERALGQLLLYRFLLSRTEPERVLYLALTQDAYVRVFGEPEGRDLLVAESVKLLIFDPEKKAVIQWTD